MDLDTVETVYRAADKRSMTVLGIVTIIGTNAGAIE